MNYKYSAIFSIFVMTALLFAPAVRAQNGDAGRAKAAFTKGTELFKNEQYKAAADAFREAYTLKPSWKILFNIAQCRAAAKEYGLALEAFEAYLAEGGDDIPPDKKTAAISEVKTLRELVGYLEIVAEDGMLVFTDDNSRGKAPLPGPVPVSAGLNHTVRFERDGKVVEARTVRVNSGTTLKVEPNAPQEETEASNEEVVSPSPASPPTEPASKPGKGLTVAGFTSGGVGILTLAGALGTGYWALSINRSLDEATCPRNSCNDYKKMKNLALTTNVLLGVGGTLALTGLSLIIVSAVKKRKAKHSVSLVPAVSQTAVTLVVGTRF